MDRRNFVSKTIVATLGLPGLVGIFTGCSDGDKNSVTAPPITPASDITFSNTDSETTLSTNISSSSAAIKLAATDQKSFTIKIGSMILTLTPLKSKIKIAKSTGEEIYLRFGTVKTTPSLILERNDGSLIQETPITPTVVGSWTPEDWLAKAVLVLAGALAVWLGATVVKLVATAIAFVAMNLLILSIIIAATAVLAWLLERTGWSFDGLIQLLKEGVDWIKDLLRDIIESLP